MSRQGIPTWFFVLVLVRKEGKFLLVHERKHGQLWSLPAGRVEFGEHFVEAAVRETLEESGVPVEIDGVIRLEHTPFQDGARQRLILSAHPIDQTEPKQFADEHSLKAGWFSIKQMEALELRGADILAYAEYLSKGGVVFPLSLLGSEGYF